MFDITALFEPGMRDVYACEYRIPNLIVSRNGTVFAFPEERIGGQSDAAKSALVVKRSLDDGATFSETEVLQHDPNPRISYGYASGVADLETGRVFVFYGLRVVILPEDISGEWPEKWEAENPDARRDLEERLAPGVNPGRFLIHTDDEGETWSEPRPVGDTLHVTNPVTGELRGFGPQFTGIQLRYGAHAGRLVCPGRGFTQDKPFGLFAYSHNYVVLSDDHGETWQAGGLAQTGTGEACVVELADGSVYLNSRNESLRCRGYRAWDRSVDGGKTFTLSGYDTALPEPHCAASITRLSGPPDKSRVLFCNPAVYSDTSGHYDHDGRRNLTVRMSEDEGESWSVSRTVYKDRSGYSAIAAAQDGTILCTFETAAEKGYTGKILLARFDLGWLTQQS